MAQPCLRRARAHGTGPTAVRFEVGARKLSAAVHWRGEVGSGWVEVGGPGMAGPVLCI